MTWGTNKIICHRLQNEYYVIIFSSLEIKVYKTFHWEKPFRWISRQRNQDAILRY